MSEEREVRRGTQPQSAASAGTANSSRISFLLGSAGSGRAARGRAEFCILCGCGLASVGAGVRFDVSQFPAP